MGNLYPLFFYILWSQRDRDVTTHHGLDTLNEFCRYSERRLRADYLVLLNAPSKSKKIPPPITKLFIVSPLQ